MGAFSGTAITTGSNIIAIGTVTGVHSIFGQVSDRTYIANILGASVDPLRQRPCTSMPVEGWARSSSRLDPNAAYLDLLFPKAPGPKACPTTPSKPR
jgi:hypothetical protein